MDILKYMKWGLCGGIFGVAIILPLFSFAAVQKFSIITRPGVATAPIKYYFDISPAMAEGINQAVKVTVSASNSEKTAVRFDSVKLFDQSGAAIGNNVASKTDALSITPYAFVFQNFGVSAEDLAKVAGVELTFLDLGGENPTGRVTVQSVSVSVDRSTGESCIIADPFIVKLPVPPPPTVVTIQASRPLVQPGTHGTGTSGGGEAAATAGPNFGSSFSSNSSNGSNYVWDLLSNLGATDGLYVTNSVGGGGSPTYTQQLRAIGFNFSIPTGATINGLEATVRRYATISYQDVTDESVYFLKNNTAHGSNLASSALWSASDEDKVYGGSSNLAGGTWTASDINNANFGMYVVAGETASGIGASAYIDSMKIKIYYTTGGGSVYDAFMDLKDTFLKKFLCKFANSKYCLSI